VREQRIALEDQAAIALPGRQVGDVALADGEFAGARRDEARDHAQRRGLAAAGGAEQDQELAVGDIDGDVVDHGEVAVGLARCPIESRAMGQTTRLNLT
jgi:hypothetical protein